MDRDLSELPALCRVCMEVTTTDKSSDIYSAPLDPEQLSLHSMLKVVCGPVFSTPESCSRNDERSSSEDMPRNVCIRCHQDVVTAYELYLRCIDTNEKLHELIMMKYAREAPEMKFLRAPSVEQELIDEKEEPMDMDSSDEVYERFHHDDSEEDVEGIALQESRPCPSPVTSCSSSGTKTKGNLEKSSVSKKRRSRKPTVPVTCEFCLEEYKSSKILQVHMNEMHSDNIVNCDACQMAFFTTEQFEEHRQLHETGRFYACEFCDKRYKNQSTLYTHLHVHKNKDPVLCTVCGQKLANKIAIKYHMAKFHAEMAFACERCPLRFISKAKLTQHMLSHTGEKIHVCDICGSRFGKAANLKIHVKRIHEGQRNHPCTLCSMKFQTAENLRRHIRTHTGEKPYKCAYCDRAYTQNHDLVRHSKVHIGENPYGCDRCDARFRLQAELRNHYAVHFLQAAKGGGGGGAESDASSAN